MKAFFRGNNLTNSDKKNLWLSQDKIFLWIWIWISLTTQRCGVTRC